MQTYAQAGATDVILW